MDWTKLNETIDPRWHEIDDPIPVYHLKEKLEPKQIYISTAGTYGTPYYQMYKEYLDRLTYERSCSPPKPIRLKLSEELVQYLKEYYQPDISCSTDDMPEGVSGYWMGMPFSVIDTLKDKLYEFEFKTEQEKQKFERGLRAKIPSLYNDVMTEDGLTLMTNEEIVDKFGCTSFMLTPEQIKQLLEQNTKENSND